MKKLQISRLIFIAVISTFIACNSSSKETKAEQSVGMAKYQCPMDCENGKTYEQPGKCAVCEMDLEKFNKL